MRRLVCFPGRLQACVCGTRVPSSHGSRLRSQLCDPSTSTSQTFPCHLCNATAYCSSSATVRCDERRLPSTKSGLLDDDGPHVFERFLRGSAVGRVGDAQRRQNPSLAIG
ncbi:hypothetical protein ISCGN_030162 [Ixodes scapularis]